MADETKNKPVNSAPPSAPPPIVTQTRVRSGRPWLALLLYLLIALVVAIIIVLGGRWLYHTLRSEPAKQTTTSNTDKTAEQKAQTQGEKTESSSSNKSSNSSSSAQSSNSESQTDNSSSESSGELANTGPGQVAALFVTVTLAVSGLHFIYSLRRTN